LAAVAVRLGEHGGADLGGLVAADVVGPCERPGGRRRVALGDGLAGRLGGRVLAPAMVLRAGLAAAVAPTPMVALRVARRTIPSAISAQPMNAAAGPPDSSAPASPYRAP
jgi:hypothetical protein